jgi:DNA-binding Lrp family transcriptional regulator
MHKSWNSNWAYCARRPLAWVAILCDMAKLDRTDARILLALCEAPRASGMQIATLLNLARNTVQSRLSRWESGDVLAPIDRCVSPRDLGYPLRAFIAAVVDQHKLEPIIDCLAAVPEVTEVVGISGTADLHIEVNTTDADDLYRVAGLILAVPGIERTVVSVAMRQAILYRTRPILARVAGQS